jgi:hypothetical protein
MIALPIDQYRVVVILIVDGLAMLWRRQSFQIYLCHISTLSRGSVCAGDGNLGEWAHFGVAWLAAF